MVGQQNLHIFFRSKKCCYAPPLLITPLVSTLHLKGIPFEHGICKYAIILPKTAHAQTEWLYLKVENKTKNIAVDGMEQTGVQPGMILCNEALAHFMEGMSLWLTIFYDIIFQSHFISQLKQLKLLSKRHLKLESQCCRRQEMSLG